MHIHEVGNEVGNDHRFHDDHNILPLVCHDVHYEYEVDGDCGIHDSYGILYMVYYDVDHSPDVDNDPWVRDNHDVPHMVYHALKSSNGYPQLRIEPSTPYESHEALYEVSGYTPKQIRIRHRRTVLSHSSMDHLAMTSGNPDSFLFRDMDLLAGRVQSMVDHHTPQACRSLCLIGH